jgi:CRP/FNR family transcriptional regulator, anaerobic regulatory protein
MVVEENIFEKYTFTEADIHYTMACFVPATLQANSFFLRKGEISGRIAFVTSGLLRSFLYDNDGNEITTQFFQPKSLVISFDSFNNQIPSAENIVSVTDSELFVIDYQKMKGLYEAIPAWNLICRDLADRKSDEMLSRSVQFQTLAAAERYQLFCTQYPDVIKATPLKHIASYLGIDIATLSRIRKKK